ncbi:MAG: TonB-dependent receptor [Bacteroidetes bacterium]|nr:MAG: TonB-dependent receptor [Bacteroidota bacterium]
MGKKLFFSGFLLFLSTLIFAQKGVIRGFVYDAKSGDPIVSAIITFEEIKQGAYADERGLYSISNIASGEYHIQATSVGYDTSFAKVKIKNDKIVAQNFYLNATSKALKGVSVSAEKLRKSKEVNISQTRIKPVQLTRIPSVGGEPDLVQYLQVLPGVVFSGDQGGQLYIRGGSPVMNRVMLDGLTVYNPFHSIGLFSVFDSDILKSVDVYSAGFSAEYGGRISAIIDVKTREGNKTGFHGKVNSSPFNSKILLEGPLKKYETGKGSSSYIVSYKNSYLNKSAPIIYPYVNDGNLPYSFSDLYSKLSFNAATGSNIHFFGFDYKDNVDFEQSSSYAWKSRGLGTKFLLVPGGSKVIVDGSITYSNYLIEQKEVDLKPRKSGVNGYNVNLNFTRFFSSFDKLNYGLEMNGFRTNFEIFNSFDRRISQFENTSEINGFVNYLKNFNKKLLLEMGLRIQRYASLRETTLEPRLRMKYNFNTRWRFKASGGYYSQNLMSAVSDRDVVNLFYGFLSGPDDLPKTFLARPVETKLQKSRHAVAGFEFDINSISEINVEGYIKDFTQLTNINRDKIFDDTPENNSRPRYLVDDFIVEEGEAFGFDITYKLESKQWYIWTVYSFNVVNRYYDRGEKVKYQPHFDRRHNINLVNSYDFGKDLSWTANVRWNFGSGFPFTLTQGFYEILDFSDGASTDYTSTNGDLGIYYDDLNKGRLPYYHRLDASIKRKFKIATKKKNVFNKAEVILSVTNIYNRENIFYFDRVNYKRENQLPILPSLSASYSF